MKMNRSFYRLALASAVGLSSVLAVGSAEAFTPPPLFGVLLGGNQANDQGMANQGDPDGLGAVSITVVTKAGASAICYAITTRNLALPAIEAHIHKGNAGFNGPVVVPFNPPDLTGTTSGCSPVTRQLALDIQNNPQAYYVNIHTPDFQEGAVRGQLY
jgi:CHRD domain